MGQLDNQSQRERLATTFRWLLFAMAGTERTRRLSRSVIRRLPSREVTARQRLATQINVPHEGLERDGFAVIDLRLPDELADFATGVAASRPSVRSVMSGLVPQSSIHLGHPLMMVALNPGLLDIAAGYLGEVPVITEVDVWRSAHRPGAWTSSQLFHCDYEDVRQLKAFVYVVDVTEEMGPLVVLPAGPSAEVKRRLRYRYGGSYRLSDDQVKDIVGDAAVPLPGPAGTVIVADTSRCFHYGSRIAEGGPDRVIAQVQYLTTSAFDLVGNYRAALPFRDLASTSPLERAVLGKICPTQ